MLTDAYPSILREEVDQAKKEIDDLRNQEEEKKEKEREEEEEEQQQEEENNTNKEVNLGDMLPVAFCRSSLRSLVVKSGEEAVSLLLSSQRIYDDLFLSLQRVKEKGVKWEMEVLVREWRDIDPALEVRGFVVDRKIVALCQYQVLIFFFFL